MNEPMLAWRQRLGLSQRAAAEALGVTLPTYQSIERGERYTTGAPAVLDRRTALACAALDAGLPPIDAEAEFADPPGLGMYDLGDLLVHIGLVRVLHDMEARARIGYERLFPRVSPGLSKGMLDGLVKRARRGTWRNERTESTHPFAQNTGRRSLARGAAEAREHLKALDAENAFGELVQTLGESYIGPAEGDLAPLARIYPISLPAKYRDGGAWNMGSIFPGVITTACGPGRVMSAWAAALAWEAMDWLEDSRALVIAVHPLYVLPVPLRSIDLREARHFWRSAHTVMATPHAWFRFQRESRQSPHTLEFWRDGVEFARMVADKVVGDE